MTLKQRIHLVVLALAVAVTAVGGWLLYGAAADEARAGIAARLETGVRLLAAELARADAPIEPARLDDWIDRRAAEIDARLTLIPPSGRVAADSDFDGPALAALDNHNTRPEVIAARDSGEGSVVRYSRSVGRELFYRARRVDGGPWDGSVIRMAVPATRLEAARRGALVALGLTALAALALALVAARALVRRTVPALDAMERAVTRAAAGDLAARARVAADDEAGAAAAAVDAALERLGARIRAAESARDRLEAVVSGMTEGVVATDADGRIVLANPALEALFGLERPVVGRTVMEALRHPGVADVLEAAAGAAGSSSAEVRVSRPRARVLDVHAVGLADGGAVGVCHDVTAQARAEEVRREFVANVSHELQTPLATVSAHAEEAADPTTPPGEARRAAGVILRHVARMSELVRDLLDLARVEAEGFAPAVGAVDVPALVAEVAAEWSPRAEGKGVGFDADAEPGLVVRGDRRLLRQALGNLLDNAVKYCPEGSRIRLSARGEGERAVLEVADDGPGIPPEDQPRIFERFYRVEKGRGRGTGGTGLGLAIVKHVAEVHGGTAVVESRPGEGAAFRISLPLG